MADLTARTRTALGWLAVMTSAVCFYSSTATIRWAQLRGAPSDPAFYTFTRLSIGFLFICTVLGLQRRPPRARRLHFLLGRAVFNTAAVYCFYQAVESTSVANANILNMTYPVFVALFTWLFLKEQRDRRALAALAAACAGVLLILYPSRISGTTSIDLNNIWGLASGGTAAAGIIYLNLCRRMHDSETVLFYMFGLGGIAVYALFHARMVILGGDQIFYLLLCGLLGIGGQYLLTFGFRYVTAVEGSIISSTRILLAAVVGPWLALDPPLALRGWIGALLLFGANVYLALRLTGGHVRESGSVRNASPTSPD
jgi:drug/metabolite transporter (DMT)-like permease